MTSILEVAPIVKEPLYLLFFITTISRYKFTTNWYKTTSSILDMNKLHFQDTRVCK